MSVKINTNLCRVEHKAGRPKTTSIGQGLNSRPRRRGKKKTRGQGKA